MSRDKKKPEKRNLVFAAMTVTHAVICCLYISNRFSIFYGIREKRNLLVPMTFIATHCIYIGLFIMYVLRTQYTDKDWYSY